MENKGFITNSIEEILENLSGVGSSRLDSSRRKEKRRVQMEVLKGRFMKELDDLIHENSKLYERIEELEAKNEAVKFNSSVAQARIMYLEKEFDRNMVRLKEGIDEADRSLLGQKFSKGVHINSSEKFQVDVPIVDHSVRFDRNSESADCVLLSQLQCEFEKNLELSTKMENKDNKENEKPSSSRTSSVANSSSVVKSILQEADKNNQSNDIRKCLDERLTDDGKDKKDEENALRDQINHITELMRKSQENEARNLKLLETANGIKEDLAKVAKIETTAARRNTSSQNGRGARRALTPRPVMKNNQRVIETAKKFVEDCRNNVGASAGPGPSTSGLGLGTSGTASSTSEQPKRTIKRSSISLTETMMEFSRASVYIPKIEINFTSGPLDNSKQ